MKRALTATSLVVAALLLWQRYAAAHADLPMPRSYVARRAATPPTIDGRLDDPAWQAAAWTDLFVDIEGEAKPKPPLSTRAKMLWDDHFFYVAAELEEPNLWGTITEHDAVIFRDHDFEVFVDPDGDSLDYREFEINAHGAYWDLLMPRPYRAGGRAIDSWDNHGLKSAVHLDGTLNNPADTDRGWTVELAFPWSAFSVDERKPSVPAHGDQWRINFSRVEWELAVANGVSTPKPGVPEHNWVWSPQRVVDMHRPERWGFVQFATQAAAFVPDDSWPARQWLQSVFEAQREFQMAHARYAASLTELGITAPLGAGLSAPTLAVTPTLFEATIEQRRGGQVVVWHIRQDARVWRG